MNLRIALAQINVTVGDFPGNEAKITESFAEARRKGADLVVFPELAVTGYPPEDLLFKKAFVRAGLRAADRLVKRCDKGVGFIGFVDEDAGGRIYNAAAVCFKGTWVGRHRKMELPNYGVFDEKRYFTPGSAPFLADCVVDPKHAVRIGVSVCEDIWVDGGPTRIQAQKRCRILVNLSASPYHTGKRLSRERMLIRRARECTCWIVYLNLVGGQDELVFDGGSMVVNPSGKVVFRAPQFEEGVFLTEISVSPTAVPPSREIPQLKLGRRRGAGRAVLNRSAKVLEPDEEIFKALVLGLKDYVHKNGFSHVVVGLSGGIDSAVTAAIAVAALGNHSVTGVSMPSRYSSAETKQDAHAVAASLGIQFLEIPIEGMLQASLRSLEPVFMGLEPNVTEENIQARLRGMLLMALSNKFGWLVLATGNKSEISTGYCTLYGDMVGGFAVIKDVPKTWVYRVGRFANRHFGRAVIPESTFKRVPTAELKPGQKDQDILPPYSRLDSVIRAYVEENKPIQEIRRTSGLSKKALESVIQMIDRSEYKRRQAPLGIKITPRAYGRDRRMPLTSQFREF
ncbi:MAG: NAD+ synthase [Candidatus Omnitrophica bacterium]|nr:NAD+ synthase [Candidatus Omnitrophota bacterium]